MIRQTLSIISRARCRSGVSATIAWLALAAALAPVTSNQVQAADDTVDISNSVTPSSCRQITTTSFFDGDDNADGSTRVEYRPSGGSGDWASACAELTGASPRQCLVIGLAGGTRYDLRFTFSDGDGVDESNGSTSLAMTPACNGDRAPPTLLVLAPARGAIVGGSDRVKLQVWDADDPDPTVEFSVNGGAFSATTENTNYTCGNNCRIHEFELDTVGLGNGGNHVTLRAIDAGANQALLHHPFRVNNHGSRPGGDGLLLRRTQGSQLCIDCHNLPTHSSQMTDTDYGNWAVACLDCHTAHATTNIFLIRQEIRTPASGKRAVRFEDGGSGAVADSSSPGTASFANEDNATQADGPCQACHTRTGGVTARWRNHDAGGNEQSHYTAGTQNCMDCHAHADGFRGVEDN